MTSSNISLKISTLNNPQKAYLMSLVTQFMNKLHSRSGNLTFYKGQSLFYVLSPTLERTYLRTEKKSLTSSSSNVTKQQEQVPNFVLIWLISSKASLELPNNSKTESKLPPHKNLVPKVATILLWIANAYLITIRNTYLITRPDQQLNSIRTKPIQQYSPVIKLIRLKVIII
ncbi:hypothetical protein OXYTRIMIC_173 [Oxytricha trifallax]|uniref:Uncharacterized protein n=1 Tax=Oxytricha trifallax TaxID=1172189 RepID=A0A073HXI2_9SPIT|nr:hypothetical protein OXYTRIMIC_173 [Oxytricha trifallax]